MKKLLVLLLIGCTFSSSAQIVSGIYLGKLVNDSTKKVQNYELALSEYRGKISGFSYTTFVSNDTFYYSIKKIKATRENGQLIIEDDKMIINNFPEAPAKKVHQINYIKLTNEDTLRNMDGKWETTRTKIYYSLTGGLDIRRDNDSGHSALVAHLKELNLIGNNNYRNTDNSSANISHTKNNPKNNSTGSASTSTSNSTVATSNGNKKGNEKTRSQNNANTPVKTEQPVLTYDQRKNKPSGIIEVQSDSILLSFYDNGVIDGDSISIYLNGKNIISHARLSATATKQKISIGDQDDLNLVLVAENMGTIPPNTGLLTIRDGDNYYQVNFSADMETNAAIIIRHKKKQQ